MIQQHVVFVVMGTKGHGYVVYRGADEANTNCEMASGV